MRFAILSLLFLPSLIRAHSWLECAKYGNPLVDPFLDGKTYDINKCQGFARNFQKTFGAKASHVFGNDRGFNVQPGLNALCDNRPQNGYTTDYPMARYSPGERVRLVWPAKNHDAEVCTNPFIPDTAMKIYATLQSNGINGPNSLGSDTTNPASGWRLVADFKASQIGGKPTAEGFQRCPDFCGARGTDKAICFQDMIIPQAFQVGQTYTFLWYWIFNQGSPAYTTCWDVTMVAGGGNPSPTTTTTQQGQPPATTSTTTTTQGGGGGNAVEQSVRIEITNTAGVFDEAGLKQTISTQLGVLLCKVVTSTFSGSTQNGQAKFTAIFFVNVLTTQTGNQIAKVSAPGFLNAISATTGGSNSIATPSTDVAASDSCSTSSTSTAISRFTISLVVSVSTNPGVNFAGPLALAIDNALNRNTPSIKADVSCVTAAQSGSFNCAIIVFTVQDVITTVSLVGTPSFISVIASLIPASANNNQAVAAGALTVSGVPQNAGSNAVGSGATPSPTSHLSGSLRMSGTIGFIWSVFFGCLSLL